MIPDYGIACKWSRVNWANLFESPNNRYLCESIDFMAIHASPLLALSHGVSLGPDSSCVSRAGSLWSNSQKS